MKKLIAVLMIVALVSSLTAADFSGTWVLNPNKSDLGEGRRGRMAATQLIVSQDEKSVTIKSTRRGRDGQERVDEEQLTLDGTQSTRSTDWAEIVSSAKIVDDVLNIAQTRTFTRNGETREMKSQQEWRLDDGVLIIEMKAESFRGQREMKMVYNKK